MDDIEIEKQLLDNLEQQDKQDNNQYQAQYQDYEKLNENEIKQQIQQQEEIISEKQKIENQKQKVIQELEKQKKEFYESLTPKQREIQEFRDNLPIYQFKSQIIDLIKKNNFVVLTGDTGSGKSTQLPQYIYDSEEIKNEIFGVVDENNENLPEIQIIKEEENQDNQIQLEKQAKLKKEQNQINKTRQLNIVTTQPRRVAAISMAKRICYEREATLGEEVGYTIRFDDTSSDNTRLKYVTDGILVRECLQDKNLSKYNIIILDEAHERSKSTDILFALVKQAVLKRQGSLKLIVTSATLNTDQFSNYFNKCPVLKMKGRSFPVEIQYTVKPGNRRVDESVTAAIRMHLHEGPGDILIFLTGKEECEAARRMCLQKLQELVQKRSVAKALIYTLYGSQHSEDQQQVFQKAQTENTRKIIFTTNIAETSLTIDGIGFVIDCGYVKEKCYNPRTGLDALIAVPISKVQAIQRTGRAGRTQEGKCFRLFSDQFYREQMKDQPTPEILRVNLANVILELKNMNIDDILNFDFMEKPDNDTILQALKQLYLLDAIDQNGKITELGKQMCRFPLEPSYSKALITSIIFDVSEKMITLVSMLSTEQIWIKPPRIREEEYKEFEKIQATFQDLDGDHESLIKIRNRWVKSGFSDQFCKQNCLNSRALKQAENIRVQLEDLIKGTDINVCKQYYKEDAIYKIYKKSYLTTRDKMTRHPKHGYNIKKEEEYTSSKKENQDDKENQELSPSQVFRLAITNGFYFNTARKVANQQDRYLLIFTDTGNIVDLDPSSVYVMSEYYPNSVVYTELGGNSIANGVLRLVSEIKYEWIKDYDKKIQRVDLFQLAGIQNDKKRPNPQIKDENKNKNLQEEKSKEQKKLEALQKFQQRKKVQTSKK